ARIVSELSARPAGAERWHAARAVAVVATGEICWLRSVRPAAAIALVEPDALKDAAVGRSLDKERSGCRDVGCRHAAWARRVVSGGAEAAGRAQRAGRDVPGRQDAELLPARSGERVHWDARVPPDAARRQAHSAGTVRSGATHLLVRQDAPVRWGEQYPRVR